MMLRNISIFYQKLGGATIKRLLCFALAGVALLTSAAAWALDKSDVEHAFQEIAKEIRFLVMNNKPSARGETKIISALNKVFNPGPFVSLAKLPAFKAKKGAYQNRINEWQTVANYALWGVCFLSSDDDLKAASIESFHELFAPHGAFAALVRDLQFNKIKAYLNFTNENFLFEGMTYEGPEEQEKAAQAAMQQVGLQIFAQYLFLEGIKVAESDFLPAKVGKFSLDDVYGPRLDVYGPWPKDVTGPQVKNAISPPGGYRLNVWIWPAISKH